MTDSTDDVAIRHFYDELFDRALHIVKTGEEHPPLIVSLERDGSKAAYLISCLPKELVSAFHQTIVARPGCVAAALITESWYVTPSVRTQEAEQKLLDTLDTISVSEHPDRKEAVVFYFLTPTQQAMLICPINRKTRSMEKAPFEWIAESKNPLTGRLVRRTPLSKLN